MLQPVDLIAAWLDASTMLLSYHVRPQAERPRKCWVVYGFMATMATEDVDLILAMNPLRLDDIKTRDQEPCAPMLFIRRA